MSAELCANCGRPRAAGARFCEACGYNYSTAEMPDEQTGIRPAVAVDQQQTNGASPRSTATPNTGISGPIEGEPQSILEITVDPDWYAEQDIDDPIPIDRAPRSVLVTGRSLLIGRHSDTRRISPQIDCGDDPGASRRQAQLTTDGRHWWIEDLDSANGTYLADESGPMPAEPIPVGIKYPIRPGERIYLGAWTRIVIQTG